MEVESFEGRRRCVVLSAIAASLVLWALGVAPAGAAETHVPTGFFCAPSGEGNLPCEPSFEGAYSLAVDQASKDLFVLDANAATVLRFKANGEPDPFSALGTNVIDGKGPGLDETPENGLSFSASFPNEAQIAVDNSGGETDGNIYVTQQNFGSLHLVDIFASTGEYLGQLTGVGATSFGSDSALAGVSVDPGGNVFVSDFKANKIYKYTSSANPPENSDGHVFSTAVNDPGRLAAGVGPSAGTLFVGVRFGKVLALSSSGVIQCEVQGGENLAVAVN